MNWIVFKVALIIIGIGMSFYLGPMTNHAKPPITLPMLIVPVIFGAISVQIAIAFVGTKKDKWQKPSWYSNPLNLNQPVHFFHFAGWFMAISVLPTVILTLWKAKEYLYDSAMPLSLGIGVIIGVYLSLALFKGRYESV